MNSIKTTALSAATAIAFSTLFTGCFGVRFSTPADNITRPVSINGPLHGIQTTGTADIEYTLGPETKVTISAPEKAFEQITLKIERGILKIGMKEQNRASVGSINNKYRITAHVTAPAIDYLSTSGTGDIDADRLKAEKIELRTYGTGDIKIGDIECIKADIETSGTGDIEIGTLIGSSVFTYTNGTGDIDILSIDTSSAIFKSNGTGDITINDGKILDGTFATSGTGDITARNVKVEKKRVSQSKMGKIEIN